MKISLALGIAAALSAGCSKGKPQEPTQELPAKKANIPSRGTPKPGNWALAFDGALRHKASGRDVTCDAGGTGGVWARSGSRTGKQGGKEWSLSFLPTRGWTLHMRTAESFIAYSAMQGSGAKPEGGKVSLDVELTADTGETVRVAGTLTCPWMPKGPPPAELVEFVRKLAGKRPRLFSTYDFGRAKYGGAVSIIDKGDARDLVSKLRSRLPAGWVAYVGTTRWLGKERPDGVEVVVGPGSTQLDVLRLARSDAVNYGMGTEDLVDKLSAWDRAYGIDISHAETDTVVVELTRMPKDLGAFAKEVYGFCPDVVDQGVGTVDRLAEEIAAKRAVYLWWD